MVSSAGSEDIERGRSAHERIESSNKSRHQLPAPPTTEDESLSETSVHGRDDQSTATEKGDEEVSYFVYKDGTGPTLFHKLCLNGCYSLRTQLMLSFGTVHVMTILIVVAICSLVAYRAGEQVKAMNQASFEALLTGIQGKMWRKR